MKFTIEVEDFWLEEDSEDLVTELQSYVKRDVLNQISKNIEDKVEKQITEKINEVMDKKMTLILDNTLTDLIAPGTIHVNREDVTIVNYIKKLFQQNTGWNQPKDQIAKIAKAFGAEMKAQYNAVFASKIVESMKEQGLLKDDVVKILLNSE